MTPAEARALAAATGQLAGAIARVTAARQSLAAIANVLDDLSHAVVKMAGLDRSAAVVLERMVSEQCDALDLASQALSEARRLLARVQP